MNNRMLIYSALVAALFSAASCVGETPEPESGKNCIANAPAYTRITHNSIGARLSPGWKSGDVVWLGSDKGQEREYIIKDEDINDGNSVRLNYGRLPVGTSSVFAAVLGKKGESSFSNGVVTACPAYDGSLAEAALFAAAASSESSLLDFIPIVPMVEFSLKSGKVAKVELELSEDAFPESFQYDLISNTISIKNYRHSILIEAVKDKNLYLPIAPGVKVKSFNFKLFASDGTLLAENAVEADMAVDSGKVLVLGIVDTDISEKEADDPEAEFQLAVPMVFNKNGSSSWPFSENAGNNSRHSNTQVFHTIQGYAVFFSGIEHVLHSSNGWVTVVRTENDYIELPTFTKGRILSVSVRYGATPANAEFVDSKGNVLKGGEQLASVAPEGEYTYNFTDTEKGEPCRMRFKTKKNVTIREITAKYLFDSVKDASFSNKISSIRIDDSSRETGITEGIGVYGSLATESGDMTGVTCGIEYRDYYSNAAPVQIDTAPEDFSYSEPSPGLAKYIFRAWAAPESGWREYSDDRVVYPNSIVLDFLREGKSSRALESSCVSKSPSGSFGYSATDGLTVYSSGTETYITFPAIPGKALAEILLVPGTSSSAGNLIVCQDPASADATKLAEGVLNVIRGTSLLCEASTSDTAYSLVFSSANTSYSFKRIIASYRDSDIPSRPVEEEPDDPSTDPTGLFDYKVLSTAGHPRLLASAEDFAEIRRKVTMDGSNNAVLCDASDCVMYYANYYLSKPLDLTYHLDASDKRLIEVSRSALLQLGSFAYAYNITGDKKYLNRAKVIISQICGFPDWHPSHFLDTAEMTLAAAIAYDWLYNSLTLEERMLLHSKIVNYGLKPSDTATYYGTDGNWNQVCACGMVAGALAVYEKDKQISAGIIERNVVSNRNMAKLIYYPDGNYSEGYSYWRYGTGFQTILIGMLEEIFGHSSKLDSTPGFDRTAEYMLFMDGLTGSFGYADGGSTGLAAKTGMWWFARHANDMSLVANELRLLRNVTEYRNGSESRVMFSLPTIINKIDVDYNITVRHDKDLWYGRGKQPIVMVHTGWNWDEGDHYLGIKAGVPSDGHDHMDVGSFVYEAQGQRWSTDLGKYNYADMEVEFRKLGGAGSGQTSLRWDVLRLNNFGHSTISVNAFDGSFQKRYVSDHNFSGTGEITSVIESAGELGATIDMSQVLKGQVASATRTIKLVDKTKLVIVDRITALDNLDAPVLWHMITPASVAVKSGYEILTNGGKTMYLSAESSILLDIKYIGDEYVRPSWFTPRTWDEKESVLIAGYECTIPKGRTVTLTTTVSPTR